MSGPQIVKTLPMGKVPSLISQLPPHYPAKLTPPPPTPPTQTNKKNNKNKNHHDRSLTNQPSY